LGARKLGHYSFTFIIGRPGDWATIAVESFFHSYFKNNFYMSHPNIHNLLNVLLEVQSEVYIKMRSIGMIKARKRTLKKLCKIYIFNEIHYYEEGKNNRFKFVKSVSYY
jgi:hypothetical protein